ncbi:MAG: gamma-glutamylcyclotransferase family protein [Verrucomicrobiota bacterium]|nr:gamma-glutamylcyclotransferase family protein [Verrucomicrobiota bacterium]
MNIPPSQSPAPDTLRVFVYGTLKPGGRYYNELCKGHTVKETPAMVMGKLFLLKPGYPGLTTGEDWVAGWVLEFVDHEILQKLDMLEGYDPARAAAGNEYDRVLVPVYSRPRQQMGEAWLYRMSLEKVAELEGVYLPEAIWRESKVNWALLEKRVGE